MLNKVSTCTGDPGGNAADGPSRGRRAGLPGVALRAALITRGAEQPTAAAVTARAEAHGIFRRSLRLQTTGAFSSDRASEGTARDPAESQGTPPQGSTTLTATSTRS